MATLENGAGGWLPRLWGRLRGRDSGSETTGGTSLKPAARSRRPKREWVLLESVHSAALGSLYMQQLARAGIPVMPREWGGGSAMLGGVPVGVSLFVPDDRLDEARAILDTEVEPDAGPDAES